MRYLICAGGSGGGVYPALSVWQALASPGSAVLWVGGEGGMEEELVKRAGIPFQSIPAAGLHGVGLRSLPGNLFRLIQGFFAARRIIRSFKPDVMFFTGGYVAVPVALAGRRVPILLYVPDIEPGLALKTLARFADQIALIAEDSKSFFPAQARAVVTGHPTRQGLAAWERPQARQHFGLEPTAPTLLIFGGSKGARSINQAALAILPELLAEMQVIHVSGSLDWAEVEAAQKQLAPELAARYRPFAYLHEDMGAAYTAADLVVARGGASAVGELPLFGLPAVVVPYPYAWRYQKVNADFLVRHGAAVMLPDEQLASDLQNTILNLIRSPERMQQMRRAMTSLAAPQAASKLAKLLSELAAVKRG